MWQAQYAEPSGGAAARVGAGPRLAFVWQAQYTEFSGGAGARVGAAGPRLAFVWLLCGKRAFVGKASAQSLLEELLRARAPLGRGWLLCGRRAFVGKVQYTEPPGGVAARVGAAGPRLDMWGYSVLLFYIRSIFEILCFILRGLGFCENESMDSNKNLL